MDKLKCEKCGAPLEVGGDPNPTALVTVFPENLFGCLFMLTVGPATAPCSRCAHPNNLKLPHLIIAERGKLNILYIPDHMKNAGGDLQEKLESKFRGVFAAELRPIFIVAQEPREFRRAFLERVVGPANALVHRFQRSKEPVEWLNRHEKELDAAFFGAMWLLGKNVAPLFSVEVDKELPAPFVPHDQAPDSASHVVARKAAVESVVQQVGLLLGFLVVLWADRIREQRSFKGYIERLSILFTHPSPGPEILKAAAECIGKTLDQMDSAGQSSLTNSYVVEAAMAILCHERKLTNPRKREWTRAQFLFDVARRRQRKDEDEVLLLDPAFVRATIDETQFWRDYAATGRALGLSEFAPERKEEIEPVADAALRIFPDQGRKVFKLTFRPAHNAEDSKILSACIATMRRAFETAHAEILLRPILEGLLQNRRHLLPEFISELQLEISTHSALSLSKRYEILRLVIEMLNLANYHESAMKIAVDLAAQLESKDSGELPPSERGPLYNEVGNCFRYLMQFNDALGYYDKALDSVGRDPNDPTSRVGLRNRAIVLRELHRYADARDAFAALRLMAHDDELRGIISSEAVCLLEMGYHKEALGILEQYEELLAGQTVNEPHVVEYASLLAMLLLQTKRLDEALSMAAAIEKAGTQTGNIFAQTVAWRIDLAASLRDGDSEKRDTAVAKLGDIFGKLAGQAVIPSPVLGGVDELDRALIAAGDGAAAEGIVRGLLSAVDFERSPKAWSLHLNAAQHALRKNELDQAFLDTTGAMTHLEEALWASTSSDDVLALLSPQAEKVSDLARLAMQFTTRSPEQLGAVGRVAADLRNAPVLTARLRRLVGLPPPTRDMNAETARLTSLLDESNAEIVQFVDVGDDVAVLRTSKRRGHPLKTNLDWLAMSSDDVAKISRCVDFALRQASPDTSDLPLDSVRGWKEFERCISTKVSDLSTGLPLYVIAGPVGEACLSLALSGERPLCFAPSLAGLVALRQRRRNLMPGSPWRPQSLFDFAVWFDRERPAEIEALGGVIESGAKLAATYDVAYSSAHGKDGTQDALLFGLAASDVARIACHGRVLANAEAVDLLVAAKGYLPPANLSELFERDRELHVLSWQKMANLKRAPILVVSSACDSGLAIRNSGGERLGLERPLLAAGSIAYAAPLWPVPTIPIQKIAADLLASWLASPDISIAMHLANVRARADGQGMSPLATHAFGIFGDGL